MARKTEQETLEAWLRGQGKKMTYARTVVLKAFLSIEDHVTADTLVAAVKKLDPAIGQATVFRTLTLLKESGLARSACQDKGARSFEHAYNHSHHDHLRCTQCGKFVEFYDATIERAQQKIFLRYGFTPSGHMMELMGLCPECSVQGSL